MNNLWFLGFCFVIIILSYFYIVEPLLQSDRYEGYVMHNYSEGIPTSDSIYILDKYTGKHHNEIKRYY